MFLTDNEMRTKLAAILKYSPNQLADYWDEIITDANTSAYQDILNAFLNRGYSKEQIDHWSRGYEFQRDIALFWCLVKGAGLHTFDSTYVKMLDRRAELKGIMLESGGAEVEQAARPQMVSFGEMDISKDRFNRDTKW